MTNKNILSFNAKNSVSSLKKAFALLLIILSAINLSIAQSVSVTVKDITKTSLIGATVQMSCVENSSVFYKITDYHGVAKFESINKGLYIIKITYIGFVPVEKTVNIKDNNMSFEFVMQADAVSLEEFTVTAQRPLIRQEGDRMIIDPEPLAGISTNTLEILESTPGLYVDQDGGIFLTSATPATVYINGREQKMSNQDITTILRSLPPHSIDRIEVIRTPSVRYDASSSGGIINIVLKRGMKIGRFGSVSAGMNQGYYGNRFGGFTFNNSGDNTTSYLITNYNYNDRLDELNTVRFFDSDTFLDQASKTRRQNDQIYLGYGVNYDANPNINLAYDGRVNASFRKSTSNNINLVENIEDLIVSDSENKTNNKSDFYNIQQDIGMLIKLDTIGSEWDTKFSYSYGDNNSRQDYFTEYILPYSITDSGEGNDLQNRHFLVFQSDLTYQLPLNIELETGIKSSYQSYISDADYYVSQNGQLTEDLLRTNAFNYKENINAGYLQFSRNIGLGMMLKAGVRLEHTYMNGNQTIPSDTSFVVDRADWFPYAYLSRQIVEVFGISLDAYMIYRKTINRPGYQNLNPYIRFVDQFLYETGNPALKPQFTENIEVNISFQNFPVLAIGQNYTKDIFSYVMYNDEDQEGTVVQTYDNLGKSKETYYRGIIGIPPGNRYFFALGAQYNYLEYDGVYQNQPFSFTNGSWRLFTFHSLRLFDQTRITMTGFMMTNGQWNFFELETFGQLNFGLSQTFLNKKLTVTLSARDVLRTMVNKFEFNQGSIYSYGNRYTDNMRFGINIRYNFGIRKREEHNNFMPQFEMEE